RGTRRGAGRVRPVDGRLGHGERCWPRCVAGRIRTAGALAVSRRAGRLGVGIIGAGRVGPVLGTALAGAGHALVGIAAVSEESRERADAMLPGVPILEVPRLIELSELVIIAVPDAELPPLIAGLSAAGAW